MGCGVHGGWGHIGGVGSQGVVASARKQLFNCIQRREGRKESLVVDMSPADPRDPVPSLL